MTEYILDTDTCIYWLKGKEEVKRKVEQIGVDGFRVTIITLAELKYGAYNSQKVSENLKNINNFLREVKVLLLNKDAAERFGKIKANLRRSGQAIGDFDIMIASIATVNECILVTNNVSHFERIQNLQLENWLEM